MVDGDFNNVINKITSCKWDIPPIQNADQKNRTVDTPKKTLPLTTQAAQQG